MVHGKKNSLSKPIMFEENKMMTIKCVLIGTWVDKNTVRVLICMLQKGTKYRGFDVWTTA